MHETAATIRLIKSLADSVEGNTQTLRTLLDLLPVGVAIAHDAECKTLSINRAAAQMFGMRVAGDATPVTFRLRQNGKMLPPDETPMSRCYQTAGPQLVRAGEYQATFLAPDSVLNWSRRSAQSCINLVRCGRYLER